MAAATAAGDQPAGKKGSIGREKKLLRKLVAQDEELRQLRAMVRHRACSGPLTKPTSELQDPSRTRLLGCDCPPRLNITLNAVGS